MRDVPDDEPELESDEDDESFRLRFCAEPHVLINTDVRRANRLTFVSSCAAFFGAVRFSTIWVLEDHPAVSFLKSLE
jgi:hypothetical protein